MLNRLLANACYFVATDYIAHVNWREKKWMCQEKCASLYAEEWGTCNCWWVLQN